MLLYARQDTLTRMHRNAYFWELLARWTRSPDRTATRTVVTVGTAMESPRRSFKAVSLNDDRLTFSSQPMNLKLSLMVRRRSLWNKKRQLPVVNVDRFSAPFERLRQ